MFVRVQEAPDVEQKKGQFWRAMDALKKQSTEDQHFILAPQAMDIHSAMSMELLGRVTDGGYVWNDEAVKSTLPAVNLVELKKATLRKRRGQ